ncbi:lipase maturation factor 1 isoform X2 [Ursus americanus]|uniref:lipase maturation factor 1 isoform X2 n=1 Tax=Ursus americanus TaxID=9643 RepID=UPI001E67ADFE|nr:lipase maturation factor 1 isoform X2 [Ursus americanus]
MRMRTGGPAMAAPEESLRRRKAGNAGPEPGSPPGPGRDPVGCSARLRAGTFWLTRIVLLRALAFIYFVAFLVAFHQNKQLIGDRGLLPCRTYLKSVQQYFRGPVGWDAVSYAPTVLWLLDWSHMDSNLDALALLGLGISSFVLVTGCANMVLMATLWVLYMSLVNVGQIWYSFGWESQLLETGFLGIFLCPLWTLSRLPRETPPSQIVLWGFRWLIFRIMLGAGLIKIRGDQCWQDLTCMDFHYETQPVPNPVAYFLHRSPWWVHRFETLSNHFLELVVPFFIFLGRQMCALHGALQILFQVVLIISGNLSFLNWLTMVPSMACFDDATLGFLFPSGPGGLKDRVLKLQEETARGAQPTLRCGCMVRRAVHVALGVLVAWLSVPVVINLLSPTQVMNTSFNPLRIVNTYGAFGSITKERTEVILQGTASPNASSPDAVWEDYEFKCKPGDPGRRPCLISPYHHRLDWLMWFAAFQTYEHNEWIIHLAGKLLANDATALSLLALNPFKDRAPPRWVRGEHYRYKFSRPGGQHAAAGKWWVRKRIGPYFPPLSLRDLKDYFRSREWPYPELE